MITVWLGWAICGLTVLYLLGAIGVCWWRFRLECRLADARVTVLREEIERLRGQPLTWTADETAWDGYRKFRVVRKTLECDQCYSFCLAPHDGKALPAFLPGQYVTLQVRVPGEPKPLHRCYSLSDAPGRPVYRLTVKKVRSHDGVQTGKVSSFLHDCVAEGDIVDVKAPRGTFCVDASQPAAVALVGAGIGVTPLVSMLNAILEVHPQADVCLVVVMRDGRSHVFREHLADLRARFPHVHWLTHYSAPRPEDRLGVDYDAKGHLTIEHLRKLLPSSNYEFYVCGPAGFMQTLVDGLRDWGVPRESIHTEAFGPGSLEKPTSPSVDAGQAPPTIHVRFDRSGQTVPWDGHYGSLLELADHHGIPIDSGCRAGSCGSCITAVKSGAVQSANSADHVCEDGSCLPCVCVPTGSLVLDA